MGIEELAKEYTDLADATILGIDSVQGGIQYKASDLPFRNMPFVYI
jgi:hypothetical protein